MTLELLESLIEQDFGYTHSDNWGKSREHSSLVVDRKRALWFWNSENLKGTVKDYLLQVRKLSEKDATALLKGRSPRTTISVVETDDSVPYEKLVEYLWLNGQHDRDYWYRRGLTDKTIDRFKLGFSGEWYTIPVYVDGVFRNFQCRKDVPEKRIRPWYRGVGPLLYNADILQFVDRVFITEGPVDAILLNQYGYASVSHTAGAQGWDQSWCKYFMKVKEIIYVADNDKPGIEGAIKVAKSLGETKVKVLRFRDKADKYDAVDFFRNGGTKAEFEERLSKDLRFIYEGV